MSLEDAMISNILADRSPCRRGEVDGNRTLGKKVTRRGPAYRRKNASHRHRFSRLAREAAT